MGHELREGVQSRVALPPIVICRPVASEFLDGRQLHALRMICDSLLLGPARSGDTRTERLNFWLGDPEHERPDSWLFGRDGHVDLLGLGGRRQLAVTTRERR